MNRLKRRLHLPFCNFMQTFPWNGGPSASRRKTGIMPREHFKSSIVSVGLPLWLLSCWDRNTTIVLISANIENTKKWLNQIKQIITGNGFFRWAFPEIRPGDKWDAEQITITRDKLDFMGQAQASITASSIQSGQASQHYYHAIGDDLINERTSAAESMLERAKILHSHVESLLQDWESSTYTSVMTPWGRDDLWEYQQRHDIAKGFRLFWKIGARGNFSLSPELSDREDLVPMSDPYDYPGPDPGKPWNVEGPWEPGKPILPEECPEEKLRLLEDQDVDLYSLNYLCEPYESGRNGFDLNLVRDFAMLADGTLQCSCHGQHRIEDLLVMILSDPAYSEAKRACESAMITLGLAADGCGFLLDEWGERVAPDAYIDKMVALLKQWPQVKVVGIEDSNFQLVFRHWLESLKDTGVVPTQVQFVGVKPRQRDKDTRTAGLLPSVRNGFWHKRPSMARVEGKNNLMDQAYRWWHGKKRDRLDSWAYVWDALEAAKIPIPRGQAQGEAPQSVTWNYSREREDYLAVMRQED